MARLTIAQARRIAVRAQGLAAARPAGRVDRRHIRRVLDDIVLLQIDSVNVVARAHYLPLFARLGPYPNGLLDDMAYRHRELFEYWGHEASLLPVGLHPLLRWRMARAERGETWGSLARLWREQPEYVRDIERQVAEHGPLRAADLAGPGRERRGPWWGWDAPKQALEWLLWAGRLAVARRERFERVYDVPERVLPPAVLAAPTPSEAQAHRSLLLLAAAALGVGTARDLADYFRLPIRPARQRLAELVRQGALASAQVEGWREEAYLLPETSLARRSARRALLAPFDPLVWQRDRVERLFGFHLRLEIYTPAPQRRYGYYVLPFLLGDELVARVDLKADRRDGVLRVLAAHPENGTHRADVAAQLTAELRTMAAWLQLDDVAVSPVGDLAPALASATRSDPAAST